MEDAGPCFGREFGAAGGEFKGIGAVDAVERAAMGEFGDEGEGIVRRRGDLELVYFSTR